MIKSILKIASIAALSALTGPAHAATNFVLNGSFEEGHTVGTGWDVFETVTPWYTIEGTGIEIQHNNVIGGADAQDGEYYVELDSHNKGLTGDTFTNSAMGQDIALTAGSYVLTFYYQPRTNTLSDNGIDFGIFGQSVQSVDSISSITPDWMQVNWNFSVAQDDEYTLFFAATGNENSLGGFIDNVSISAIPEPATWLMLIVGFGMVGVATRRRRKIVLA